MTANAKQSGHMCTVVAPTGGYTAGQLIELVDMVAVVEDTVAAGASVAAHVSGVFTLTKVANAAGGFTLGDSVYRTSTGNLIATATGNQYVGKAWGTAATGDTSVDVNINFGPGNTLV